MSTIHAIKEFLTHTNTPDQPDLGRIILEHNRICIQRRKPDGTIKTEYITWLQFETTKIENLLISSWDKLK